jgi:SAM-dependent methyltransferase
VAGRPATPEDGAVRCYGCNVKRYAPATERNRDFLLEVLRRVLADRREVLEVASGTGQHAVFFAAALSHLRWQPTDRDRAALVSIEAWRAEAGLPNLAPVQVLDVEAAPWPVDSADALVCINLIHIAPWSVSVALFEGAARLLPTASPLVSYGPYRFGGRTAPSNDAFDASLRAQDATWGVRDLDDLEPLARRSGFALAEVVPMPANNHTLVWRRA